MESRCPLFVKGCLRSRERRVLVMKLMFYCLWSVSRGQHHQNLWLFFICSGLWCLCHIFVKVLSNSFTIMSLSTSTGLWNSQVGDYGPEQKVNLQENSLWGFWERPHLCAIDHRLCVGKKRKGRKKELKKEINNKLWNWKEKIIEKGTWKKEKERSRICCCTKTFQSCELNPI